MGQGGSWVTCVVGHFFLIFGWVDVGRGSRGSWVNFHDPLPSLLAFPLLTHTELFVSEALLGLTKLKR